MYEGVGIDRLCDKECPVDIFGDRNMFREITTSLVKDIVSQGKWFSFFTSISDEQVDILSTVNGKGVKLGKMVSEYYPDTVYRGAIYKYLLSRFICYYECPTVEKSTYTKNGYVCAYDKYLVTSSTDVIANWLGIDYDDASIEYFNNLDEVGIDNGTDLFQYVKLYIDKEGNHKVTRPRKLLDLGKSGTRIVPLYAFQAGMGILYSKLLDGTYDVTFIKDGGVERSLNTTFNLDIIKSVYPNSYLAGVNLDNLFNGFLVDSNSVDRGYIRVFEMGSSVYDDPTRAINYARIIGFKKAEPDLAYMNIDIEEVVPSFKKCILYNNSNFNDILQAIKDFNVGNDWVSIHTVQDLENWVDSQDLLKSTVFRRELSLCMIANPHLFNGYDGSKKSVASLPDYQDNGEEELPFLDMCL